MHVGSLPFLVLANTIIELVFSPFNSGLISSILSESALLNVSLSRYLSIWKVKFFLLNFFKYTTSSSLIFNSTIKSLITFAAAVAVNPRYLTFLPQ